jgi:pantothenate synthetase
MEILLKTNFIRELRQLITDCEGKVNIHAVSTALEKIGLNCESRATVLTFLLNNQDKWFPRTISEEIGIPEEKVRKELEELRFYFNYENNNELKLALHSPQEQTIDHVSEKMNSKKIAVLKFQKSIQIAMAKSETTEVEFLSIIETLNLQLPRKLTEKEQAILLIVLQHPELKSIPIIAQTHFPGANQNSISRCATSMSNKLGYGSFPLFRSFLKSISLA